MNHQNVKNVDMLFLPKYQIIIVYICQEQAIEEVYFRTALIDKTKLAHTWHYL